MKLLPRFLPTSFFLFTSFYFAISANAATVDKVNRAKTKVILALTSDEAQFYRRGDDVWVRGQDKNMKAMAEIYKIKGKKAYLKLKKGFQQWDRKDRVRLAPYGRNQSTLARKTRSSGSYGRTSTRRYSVLPELGSSVFPVPSLGLTAGYSLKKDMILELNGARGEQDLGKERYESDPFGIRTRIATNVISMRLKKFWNSWLYTNSGMGYRDVTFSGTVTDVDGSQGVALNNYGEGDTLFSATRKDLVADLALGGRWQRNQWTFGADFLGAMIPVASMGGQPESQGTVVVASQNATPSDAAANDDNADANPNETYEDSYQYDLPGISYQARIYFGIQF